MRNLFRREPGFYKRLFFLALPMVLQNLITTALGFVDTFMVGLVGSNELSAVTAANTPIFLLQCSIFGLMSGLSVLVTQYWGHQDMRSINRCLGVVLYIGYGYAKDGAGFVVQVKTLMGAGHQVALQLFERFNLQFLSVQHGTEQKQDSG